MKYQQYIDSINNYIKNNDTYKALEYSQLLISKFPEREGGYEFLWKIYISLGKKKKSLMAFISFIKLYKTDFGKIILIRLLNTLIRFFKLKQLKFMLLPQYQMQEQCVFHLLQMELYNDLKTKEKDINLLF